MNEIEVPLKITGINAIKTELKAIKSALADATDPKEMERLAAAAGELKDQLADVNEKVSVFASGSKFEQTSNAFGLMQSQLMSLDFEGAAESAKLFTGALKSINPAEFGTQIKGLVGVFMSMGSAIGILTKQFIAFGISLLANPIFLLVAVITAIVAAILIFLNKMGILKKAIDVLMKPINDLIDGFKALTDWLGLTSYAAEENAAKMAAANEKIIASSKERQEKVVGGMDYEIRMAKIYGQDTLQLELDKSKFIGTEAKKRLKSAEDALAAEKALGDNADKEKITKYKEQIKTENDVIISERRNRNAMVAEDRVKEREEDKKDAEKRLADAKKFAQDRLAAQRLIKDIEISLIKSDADREIVATQEKYKRLQEDLVKNENYSVEEKLRLKELYDKQLEFELSKQEQIEIDAEKSKQQKLLELITANQEAQQQAEEDFYETYRTQVMSEQQREVDAVNSKYFNLIASAEQYGLDTQVLKEQQEKAVADINKKYADQQAKDTAEAEAKKRQAQLDTANNALDLAEDTTKAIQNVGDIAFAAKMAKVKKGSKEEEELAKKQFKFNKAMQLAGAIVDAGKAVTASLASAPLAIGPVPNPAGIASLAAAVTTSAVNIAKIAATQFNSTGGGGGNMPTIEAASSTSTTSVAPSFSLFGQNNNANNLGATQDQSTTITVNAVVSETELTNTQNKIAKINQNATL